MFFLFDLMEVMFCKYECGYESKHHHKDPNHMRSINHDYLTHFSINRLYTWPNMWKSPFTIRLTFKPMGILLMVHVIQGPRTSQMSMYVSCVSHIEGFYMDSIKIAVHCETNL
jgi:hypothetical protein